MHADSHFLHLGGAQDSDCPECSAAVVSQMSTVTIMSSKFEKPYLAQGSRYIRVLGGLSHTPNNTRFKFKYT